MIIAKGADEELDFWRGFVRTPQFATWLDGTRPTPELQTEIVELLRKVKGKVLDVGSGVVSILRGTVPDERLFATDLLATQYQLLFDYKRHNIQVPLCLPAEDLPFKEEFEAVHMRNALDHCQNPYVVFDRLKRAVRPGGMLMVCGFENEGTHLHGLGMHQWNLALNGDFLFVSRVGTARATVLLSHSGFTPVLTSVTTLPTGRRWVTWVASKDACTKES